MADKIQLRGHCQCCGRQQAVVRGNMSKHGYEVKSGYFQGVCHGDRYEPIEKNRQQADNMVQMVREDVIRLNQLADDLEAGRSLPERAKSGNKAMGKKGYLEDAYCDYKDAPSWHQHDALQSAIWGARNRARSGESWANSMSQIVINYHGKPLIEVAAGQAPARIVEGDRRQGKGRVLIAKYAEGQRVHWRDERGFNGWMSPKAWRLLPLPPEV